MFADAEPEKLPVETGYISPKPEPVHVEMFDSTALRDEGGGKIIGLDDRPRPGYAVTLIERRGLLGIPAGTVVHLNGKKIKLDADLTTWLRVKPYAEPRRGRSFKKKA